jgi:hypothetical protein
LVGNVGIGSEVILAVLMMKMGAFASGVTTKMASSLVGGWAVAGASRSEVISIMLSAAVKLLSGYTGSS